MSAVMFHLLILIHCITKKWSSIWYHLMEISYYPIAASPDVKVVSFIKIIFKGIFVKNWNWCIRKVVLDTILKRRTIYLTRNFHFVIELMRKYRNIGSYSTEWLLFKYSLLMFLSIKLEPKCLFIFEIVYLRQDVSSVCGLTSDSNIFAKFTWKLFMTIMLLIR